MQSKAAVMKKYQCNLQLTVLHNVRFWHMAVLVSKQPMLHDVSITNAQRNTLLVKTAVNFAQRIWRTKETRKSYNYIVSECDCTDRKFVFVAGELLVFRAGKCRPECLPVPERLEESSPANASPCLSSVSPATESSASLLLLQSITVNLVCQKIITTCKCCVVTFSVSAVCASICDAPTSESPDTESSFLVCGYTPCLKSKLTPLFL